MTIAAAELRDRLAGLDGIGIREDGVWRMAWTEELAAAEAWFREQAAAAGLRVARDPAGSLWALPGGDGPWWATGSHLDSVRAGGRFDGPLGVAAALHAAAALAAGGEALPACGLATMSAFREHADVLRPAGGVIAVPAGPGLLG